jgi:hypothetical protein
VTELSRINDDSHLSSQPWFSTVGTFLCAACISFERRCFVPSALKVCR